MYGPKAFDVAEVAELHAMIRTASLPVLVSPTAAGLAATHLPLTLVTAPDRLIGHFARANSHWREADPAARSLAIFTAAEGYVSPSWYATKAETGRVVPTWNYQAVHATGRLEIVEDAAPLLEIVSQLTDRYEKPRAEPWAVTDAPADYITTQLRGIVGVILHIETLEGKAKLSQNKSAADRDGVAKGLDSENPTLAAAMRRTQQN